MSGESCCTGGSPKGNEFDLAIVGGGSAAFSAALRASELGATTLLVNEGTIGGTCVNVGCVPSKTMIRAAENHHWGSLARFRGVKPERGEVDFGELLREKDELVESLRQAKYEDLLSRLSDVRFLEGRARFVGQKEIEVSGSRYRAAKILVASGSRPAQPSIPGLSEAGVWDSTQALQAPFFPQELVVLGGSYVALELAQMFSRLGSRVTILQRSEQILSSEDADVAQALSEFLRDEGIDVRVGQKLERFGRDGESLFVDATRDGRPGRFVADAAISALGRTANTEGLELEGYGAELDEHGFLKVGEDLQTSSPGVYGAGDVIGEPAYVYSAAYEGALAAENALKGKATSRNYTAIPWDIFSDPQVAGVGLNERQAAAAGIQVDVSILPLSYVPRALAARDTRGLVKLLRARGEDRLVGARIVAPEGSEQIMEASLMIRFGLPVSEVSKHFHPYLTQAEGMKLAMLSFDKDVEMLSCCAA